jgi:ribosomal subunit interface protein
VALLIWINSSAAAPHSIDSAGKPRKERFMQIPVQITIRDMAHSEALDQHIQAKAAKLEQYCSSITSCRVVVEAPHKHNHQGRQYVVRLDITVPGSEIVVNHEHHEDVYVALRDAFDAAKRRLEDFARIRRGETRVRQAGARRRRSTLSGENDFAVEGGDEPSVGS